MPRLFPGIRRRHHGTRARSCRHPCPALSGFPFMCAGMFLPWYPAGMGSFLFSSFVPSPLFVTPHRKIILYLQKMFVITWLHTNYILHHLFHLKTTIHYYKSQMRENTFFRFPICHTPRLSLFLPLSHHFHNI